MDDQIGEVLGKILKINNTLLTGKNKISDWDKKRLLSAATQISGYSLFLSPWMAELRTEASFLETSAKEEEIRVYLENRGTGTTQKDSEILAKQASMELLKEAIDKKGQSDKIRGVLDMASQFITVIQSNLKQDQREYSSQNIENK